MWLSPAQALWLGYLHHAAAAGQPLSVYAQAQNLRLADLLSWEQRLRDSGLDVPARRRPARFVAVELQP